MIQWPWKFTIFEVYRCTVCSFQITSTVHSFDIAGMAMWNSHRSMDEGTTLSLGGKRCMYLGKKCTEQSGPQNNIKKIK